MYGSPSTLNRCVALPPTADEGHQLRRIGGPLEGGIGVHRVLARDDQRGEALAPSQALHERRRPGGPAAAGSAAASPRTVVALETAWVRMTSRTLVDEEVAGDAVGDDRERRAWRRAPSS